MPDSTGTGRKFNRVLLKISGEALRENGSPDNISPPILEDIAQQVRDAHNTGLQIGIVVGGGNFWRGLTAQNKGMDRATADHMGMLATIMNALAIQSALEAVGVPTRVQSAIEMNAIAEPFIKRMAVRHLELGRVVVFAAGTGNPYFSTDSAAALRASEINADVIFKATKVDGIYDKDPKKHADAQRFEQISFQDALGRQLKIMDAAAFSLCMDNNKRIVVFDMTTPGNILKALTGGARGTVVCAGPTIPAGSGPVDS
ncbi:MAG: UMP kinase [Verrucomicrobiales bacterium]|nr:UMP kinase [Verrucomicrobiales bacterium]